MDLRHKCNERFTISGVAVSSVSGSAIISTPADASAAVTWALVAFSDAGDIALGNGTCTYVSAGLFTFVVPHSIFDAYVSDAQQNTGRLDVLATVGGDDCERSMRVNFVRPKAQ